MHHTLCTCYAEAESEDLIENDREEQKARSCDSKFQAVLLDIFDALMMHPHGPAPFLAAWLRSSSLLTRVQLTPIAMHFVRVGFVDGLVMIQLHLRPSLTEGVFLEDLVSKHGAIFAAAESRRLDVLKFFFSLIFQSEPAGPFGSADVRYALRLQRDSHSPSHVAFQLTLCPLPQAIYV